jgi:thioredoxin-like negative regulator of GroEL
MLERIVIAAALVLVGVLTYVLFLRWQRRRVNQQSNRRAATGRSGLLVFTSPTCARCKLQQLPIIDRVLLDWRDKIEVDLIDVTEQPDVAAQYGVWSLPTTIVLDADRKVVAINQGVALEKKLCEQIARTFEPFESTLERGKEEWQPS